MSIVVEPVAGTHAYLKAHTDALTPGTRVVVNSGHLNGQTGTVIAKESRRGRDPVGLYIVKDD